MKRSSRVLGDMKAVELRDHYDYYLVLIGVRHLVRPHSDRLASRIEASGAVVGQDVLARGVALGVVAEGPSLGEVRVAGADEVVGLARGEVAARVLAVEGEPAEAGGLDALVEGQGLGRGVGVGRLGARVAPLHDEGARAARGARAQQRRVGVQLRAVVVADQGAQRGEVQEGGDQVVLLARALAADGVGGQVEGLGGIDAVDGLGHVRALGLAGADGRGGGQAGECGEEDGGVDHGKVLASWGFPIVIE
ncbi:hypothetical protein PG995_000314 [Apiospora arundinis]